MKIEIEKARLDCDTVGGVVEVCTIGFPAGLGSLCLTDWKTRFFFDPLGVPLLCSSFPLLEWNSVRFFQPQVYAVPKTTILFILLKLDLSKPKQTITAVFLGGISSECQSA